MRFNVRTIGDVGCVAYFLHAIDIVLNSIEINNSARSSEVLNYLLFQAVRLLDHGAFTQ